MKLQTQTRAKRSAAVLFAAALLVPAVHAHGSELAYPAKTVRIVVPYTPGGGIDLIGRLVAQELSTALGQQVIVENRPGASTIIGADVVAKAAPDGHTLLVTSHSTHAFLPNLKKKLPYDADKDFDPVALLVSQSFVLVVHPSMPVLDVKQLLAFARARPGELTYSSSGLGTGTHFSGELLKTLGKVDIRHIPYKGGGQSFTELAGGHVTMSFGSIASSLPYVKAGKLRMIGSTGVKRSPAAPHLPTIAETIPGYEMTAWSALFAPGGTPRAVIERLSTEVAKAFGTPEVRNRLAALGYDVETSSPEELKRYITKERATYGRLIEMVGLER